VPELRGNLTHDFHTAVLMREHGIARIRITAAPVALDCRQACPLQPTIPRFPGKFRACSLPEVALRRARWDASAARGFAQAPTAYDVMAGVRTFDERIRT
jgi:hypothetical protein